MSKEGFTPIEFTFESGQIIRIKNEEQLIQLIEGLKEGRDALRLSVISQVVGILIFVILMFINICFL